MDITSIIDDELWKAVQDAFAGFGASCELLETGPDETTGEDTFFLQVGTTDLRHFAGALISARKALAAEATVAKAAATAT